MQKRKIMTVVVILFAVSSYLSLRYGSSAMNFAVFWRGLTRTPGYEKYTIILYTLRLPRLFAAVLAGAGLSVSGVLLQSVTGNDLASPNIIGVNSGAGFCVILFLYFFPNAVYATPVAAFAGAFLTTLLIAAAANQIGATKSNIILAGIAVTSVLNAGISFISLLDADVLTSYNYFSIGGIAGVQIEKLVLPAVLIAVSLAVSLAASREIQLLCLGDSLAVSLGVRVKILRMICLVCASLAAAAVVSFAGLLGFVGLVVPHIARKLFGFNTRWQLLAAALLGGILVTLGDLLGRVLFAPSELPVGIMMALIGAPFFFALLMGKRRELEC